MNPPHLTTLEGFFEQVPSLKAALTAIGAKGRSPLIANMHG
ncbi:hypothetical protein ACQ4M4_15780 [Leptolyngbya sp. AN02str]